MTTTDTPTTGFILKDIPRIGTAPFIACDGCGQTISHLHGAGIVWEYNDLPCTPRIYCKFHNPERTVLGCLSDPYIKHSPWMEMRDYVFYLLHNLGIRTKKQLMAEFEHAKLADRF